MTCSDCNGGWDHCHDALIIHTDGTAECAAGPGCPPTADIHGIRIPCADVSPPCGCAATIAA